MFRQFSENAYAASAATGGNIRLPTHPGTIAIDGARAASRTS